MARKPAKKSSERSSDRIKAQPYWTPNDAAWGGFINVRLAEEDKLKFAEWWDDAGVDVPQVMQDLVGLGAKLGVSYDGENECFITTLMGRLVGETDDRYCMVTRAGTFSEAWALMCWKHLVVAEGEYGDFRPKTGKFDHWG